MFCHQCGHRLPDEARFCPACGTRAADLNALAAEPAPGPPVSATPVEAALDAEPAAESPEAAEPAAAVETPAAPAPEPARAAAVQPARPPARPPAPAWSPVDGKLVSPPASSVPPAYAPAPEPAVAASSSLPPLQLVALAGFVVAIASTLLAWLRVTSTRGTRVDGVNAWDGDAQYRLADWLSTDAPIDALLVLVIGGIGIYLLLGRLLGSNVPAIPYGVAAAGATLALIGVLNWAYIDGETSRLVNRDLSVGIGVYLLIVSGAVTAFCGFRDAQLDSPPVYAEQPG